MEKTAYILVIQKNENDGKDAVKVDIPNPESEDYAEEKAMPKSAPAGGSPKMDMSYSHASSGVT